jgi:hypothetical protein
MSSTSVKFTGGIGVVGVFAPEDPSARDELAKKRKIAFDWGKYVTAACKMSVRLSEQAVHDTAGRTS